MGSRQHPHLKRKRARRRRLAATSITFDVIIAFRFSASVLQRAVQAHTDRMSDDTANHAAQFKSSFRQALRQAVERVPGQAFDDAAFVSFDIGSVTTVPSRMSPMPTPAPTTAVARADSMLYVYALVGAGVGVVALASLVYTWRSRARRRVEAKGAPRAGDPADGAVARAPRKATARMRMAKPLPPH